MGGAINNIATKGDSNSIAREVHNKNCHATGSTVNTIAMQGTVNVITMGGPQNALTLAPSPQSARITKQRNFFVKIKIDLK